MIRAKELRGLAVVDVDAATKVGKIEEVLLDSDYHQVAGFLVSVGQSVLGKGSSVVLPASCVHAVGPDALTIYHSEVETGIKGSANGDTASHGPALPRLANLLGLKVVSESGRLLGSVEDALVDAGDGRVLRYELADGHAGSKLENILGVKHAQRRDYVRADSNLRVGPDLMVVPDDAVVLNEETSPTPPSEDRASASPAQDVTPAAGPPVRRVTARWGEPAIIAGLSTSPAVTGDISSPCGRTLQQRISGAPTPVPGVPPFVERPTMASPSISASQSPNASNGAVQDGLDNDPHHDPEKGAMIGGVGGAFVGGAAGSMVGPVGTIVRALVGGISGAAGSGAAVAAVNQVGNDNTRTGVASWERVAPHYRRGWEQQYGQAGARWEEHEPAYRFAWETRTHSAFRDLSWADAETDLRSQWESRHADRPWLHVQHSVREGWEVSDEVRRRRQQPTHVP